MATNQDLSLALRYLPERYKKAYAEGKLDDTDVLDWAERTGLFQKKEEPKAKPAEKPAPRRNALDTVSDSAKAGLRRTGAGMIQSGIDSERLREREESDPWYKRDVLDFVGFGPDERARVDANIAARLQGYRQGETYSDIQRRMEAQAAQEESRVSRDVASLDSSVGRTVGRAVTDAANSPLSYLSVFGGPLGAASGLDSYARTYREARKSGVSIEDAEKIAREAQLIESGIGMVPAAKLLGPLANLGRTGGFARRAATRVGVNAAGEGLNEALTESVNMAVDAERAIIAKDEAVRAYSKDNLPSSVTEGADRLFRTFMAGAVGGGVISTPNSMFEASRKAATDAVDLMEDKAEDNDTSVTAQDNEKPFEQKVREPVQENLFGDLPTNENYEADRQRELETDAGFNIMRRQRAAEEIRQRELAGTTQQLDVARQQVEELQDRIQSGQHSNADLSALAAANRRVRGLENILTQMQTVPVQPERAPTAPERAAEQLGLEGVDVKQPQQERREAATAEARTLLQKDQEAIRKAATKNRTAEAKKFNTSLLNQARDMQPDQAVEFIAAKRQEWEAANPIDKYITLQKEKLKQTEQNRTQNAQSGRTGKPGPARKQAAPALSAEQLLSELGPDVTTGSNKPVTGVAKRMILSGGKGAERALQENRTFPSVDGKTKYEISDHESRMLPASPDKEIAPNTYRAADVIQHDRLFEEFPELAEVPVYMFNDPDAPYAGGFAPPDADNPYGAIEINLGYTKGDPLEFGSRAHRSVLHELQHAAQARAGSTMGTYPTKFLSERGRELKDQMDNLSYGIAAARDMNFPEGDIARLEAEMATLESEYGPEWDAAVADYLKVLGEQEAYSTADRLEMTDEERQVDTLTRERDITNREGRTTDADGNILAEADTKAARSTGSAMLPSGFLNGVRDAKTMLTKYAEETDVPFYRELALLLSTSRWISDVGVMEVGKNSQLPADVKGVFDDGAVGLAFFNAEDGKPFLYFDTTREGAIREEAIPHEAIHALTEAAIRRNPAKRRELERLARNVRATLARNGLKEAVKYWDDGIKNDPGELLAYGLTNPRFRTIFSKLDENGNVPGQKNPSIFQRFVDFAFDTLALPKRFKPRFDSAIKQMRTEPVGKLTNRLDRELRKLLKDTEQKGISIHGEIKAFRLEDVRRGRDRMIDMDNKVFQIVRNSFSGFGPLGRELANKKRSADGFATERSHNAANHFHEINRGITQAAKIEVASGKHKDQKTAEDAVRSQIERALKVMESEAEISRRRSVLDALVRRYPSLKGLNAALDEIAELSRTIAVQVIESSPNPTQDELALAQKIVDNQYAYATRMFSVFQGQAGRDYAKRVRTEYEKAVNAVKNGKEVPAKYKDSYRVWKNASRYLIENDLTIPSEEDIIGTSTDRLTRLYDTWVGDAARIKANAKSEALAGGASKREANHAAREALIAGLLDRAPSISKAEMEGMSEKLILGMMGLTESGGPFAQYYRGFKEDRGILKQREELPQEIRQLFGEIQDPATRLAITLSKQAELAGRQRLLLDMRDVGVGKWIIKASDAGKPGNERFTEQLKGEGYGPLNGYYADPKIASAISDSLEMFSTMGEALAQGYQNSDALTKALAVRGSEALAKLAGWQKLATVVFDVYNMGMNAIGSPIMLFANGVYNPMQWKSGVVGAVEVIWDAGSQGQVKLSQATQDAIRYGVLDSARVQEIRRTPQQFVRGLISKRPQALNMVSRGLGRTVRTTTEMFAMADAWVKISAFQERTETLRKFYDAEGIQKTEHELKMEASDNILDTNITYQRVGSAIRGAERLGFTTFMPYFVSVPRAITYNTLLATKDMIRAINAKTTEGKMTLGMAALRRMSGTAVATGGMVIGMKALAAAINDEDEDKIAAMQKLMFPDARFADSLYLGKDDEGIPLFARMSRVDPLGPVNDFARILFDEYTPIEDKNRHMVEMLRDMVITNRVVVQGMNTFVDLMQDQKVPDKDTKMERIFPKLSEFSKEFVGAMPGLDTSDGESVLAFLDSFAPGFLDAFDPKNVRVKTPSEDGAYELSVMVTAMGGRLDRADPGLAAYVAGKDLEDARKAGRKRQSDGFKAGEPIDVLQRRFLADAQEEHAAMRDVLAVWEGMTDGLDMSPRQARQLFKDKAERLTELDYRNLQYGRVSPEAHEWIARYSALINEDSQEERLKGYNSKRKLTPEEKQKLRTYLDSMKALGYKVQE